MASSETQIANLALAKLGQKRLDDIASDDGLEARWALELYPTARDYVTEDVAPRHAKVTAYLAQLATNERINDYQYAYTRPSDAMSVLYLMEQQAPFDPQWPIRFECETDSSNSEVIYTDEPNARVVYIKQATDPTKYKPSFTEAIAWYLAHLLVQPLRQDKQFFADTLNGYERAKAKAIQAHAHEQYVVRDATESQADWHKYR